MGGSSGPIAAPPGFIAFIFKVKQCDATLRGLPLTDCGITGNPASASGGSLGNSSTMCLLRCTVSDNTAGAEACAITITRVRRSPGGLGSLQIRTLVETFCICGAGMANFLHTDV